MARDIEGESDYYRSHGGIIPVKWTAPEVSLTGINQLEKLLCVIALYLFNQSNSNIYLSLFNPHLSLSLSLSYLSRL